MFPLQLFFDETFRVAEAFVHANNSPHLRFGAGRYKLSEVHHVHHMLQHQIVI